MFKTASFNCNSVRARLEIILDWLARGKPDVLCLQETKVEEGKFPAGEFNAAGYNVIYRGQKSYNGIKKRMLRVRRPVMPFTRNSKSLKQCRYSEGKK